MYGTGRQLIERSDLDKTHHRHEFNQHSKIETTDMNSIKTRRNTTEFNQHPKIQTTDTNWQRTPHRHEFNQDWKKLHRREFNQESRTHHRHEVNQDSKIQTTNMNSINIKKYIPQI